MKTKFAFRSLVAACNTEISIHSPGTTQHDQPQNNRAQYRSTPSKSSSRDQCALSFPHSHAASNGQTSPSPSCYSPRYLLGWEAADSALPIRQSCQLVIQRLVSLKGIYCVQNSLSFAQLEPTGRFGRRPSPRFSWFRARSGRARAAHPAGWFLQPHHCRSVGTSTPHPTLPCAAAAESSLRRLQP